jgi:hypothetical protein
MRRILAASVTATLVWTDGFAQAPAPQKAGAPKAPLVARLTDDVVRDAVRQALAEVPVDQVRAPRTALSGDKYSNFSRKFDEARVPDCLHPDALRHQPTSIETKNWVIGVSGIYAVPSWLAAAASGKCH